MTAATVNEPDARVRELYGRYKSLALAAGAALLLGTSRDELEAETLDLLAEARDALADNPSRRPQLDACVRAAESLVTLVAGSGDGVDAVRETHKQLRREVWKVVPCEYVPCCASTRHMHEQTGDSVG